MQSFFLVNPRYLYKNKVVKAHKSWITIEPEKIKSLIVSQEMGEGRLELKTRVTFVLSSYQVLDFIKSYSEIKPFINQKE